MKKQIERTKTNLDFEREREIRSFQSKGNRIQVELNSTILSAEKSARRSKTSKKEKTFLLRNNYPCFI